MNNRYWRDLVARDHGLWRGAIPVTVAENLVFDAVMRLAKKEEDDELLAELTWRAPRAPVEIRAANKLEGRRRGGDVTGGQRTNVRRIRRILIEEFLFGPQKEGDMPDDARRHPYGEDGIEWLVNFFEQLAKTELLHPLNGASEDTLRRDIAAIRAKRRKLN
ncbi:MAG TPA: hypothetical protein VFE60_01055 [Roseiarcus sp.]|jgi:hypothetical protein|nr:hypothetical protein [Roseiarcus sp.]